MAGKHHRRKASLLGGSVVSYFQQKTVYTKAEVLNCMAHVGKEEEILCCGWITDCFGEMSGHELLCKQVDCYELQCFFF